MRGMRPPIDEAPELESQSSRSDWATLRTLFPYLWRYRQRVILALLCLVLAKVATVSIPLLLKQIVDGMTAKPGIAVMVPLGLILAYGAVRLASTAFVQVRNAIFAKVEQGAIRQVALEMFNHLHQLSLRFHLDRQTGGVSRDIARGTRGIGSLLSFLLFSIIPTLLEIALTTAIFMTLYDWRFVSTTLVTVVIYVVFTIVVTNWRTQIRRTMNELDSRANVASIDSLLNYETVKYFNAEHREEERYAQATRAYADAAVKSENSLGLLNIAQALVVNLLMAGAMAYTVWGWSKGLYTVGQLVFVQTYLTQLFRPLDMLGMVYRTIRQGLIDMAEMFRLIDTEIEVRDAPGAPALVVRRPTLALDNVVFGYDPDRTILKGLSFEVPAGWQVALVGPSGAGKSSIARLVFRFYDPWQGRILIDGQDIREVTQESLRRVLGIVPQDSVLFNESIGYNIAYGRDRAGQAEVEQAARDAALMSLIERLPQGFDTQVGERGLKLSGGEKQRVAIARTLVKNPPILLLDEATSALDSRTEQDILATLHKVSTGRTSLSIAHRLSTIADADTILVLSDGQLAEQGDHQALLKRGGLYAEMWARQAEAIEEYGQAAE